MLIQQNLWQRGGGTDAEVDTFKPLLLLADARSICEAAAVGATAAVLGLSRTATGGFSAGAAAAMARGRCGVLLLLFLVLGIRVVLGGKAHGRGPRSGCPRRRRYLSVTSVGALWVPHGDRMSCGRPWPS